MLLFVLLLISQESKHNYNSAISLVIPLQLLSYIGMEFVAQLVIILCQLVWILLVKASVNSLAMKVFIFISIRPAVPAALYP